VNKCHQSVTPVTSQWHLSPVTDTCHQSLTRGHIVRWDFCLPGADVKHPTSGGNLSQSCSVCVHLLCVTYNVLGDHTALLTDHLRLHQQSTWHLELVFFSFLTRQCLLCLMSHLKSLHFSFQWCNVSCLPQIKTKISPACSFD